MANTRISDLTASASNLASTDLAPVVQTVGVGPVKMTGAQIAAGLLSATTPIGSGPILSHGGSATLQLGAADVATTAAAQTLQVQSNTGAANGPDFTIKGSNSGAANTGGNINFQLADAGAYSTQLYLRTDKVAVFGSSTSSAFNVQVRQSSSGITVSNNGGATTARMTGDRTGSGGGARIHVGSNAEIGWNDATTLTSSAFDTILTRGGAAATLQLGAADAAAPVAQFFKVQGVVAGTTNTAGANFTIQGSQGTGTGAGGSIIFQVAPAGSSGTAQNAYSTAMSLNAVAGSSPYAILGVGTASGYNGFQIQTGGYSGGACFVGDTATQGTVFGVHPAFAFAWSNGNTTPTATYDLFLARDAANTLALRNGTSAQLFRVYSTTASSGSYGYLAAGVTDAGVATADTLFIGTGGTGAALTKLALVVNGTTRADWNISNASNWTISGSLYASGAIYGLDASIRNATITDFLYVGGVAGNPKAALYATTTNKLMLYAASSDGTPITLLSFGSLTSSHVALKPSSTTLQVRLADDTGFGSFQTGGFSGGAPTIKTANYTQLEADYSLIFNGTGSITLTLLAAATYPGKILYVKTIAAQTVVSASSNVKPIDTDTAGTAILAATAGKWAMLQSDGTDWVIMAQG